MLLSNQARMMSRAKLSNSGTKDAYTPPVLCFISNHYSFSKLAFGHQAKIRINFDKVFIISKRISNSFLLA